MPTPINALFDKIHTIPQIPEVVRTIINQLNHPHSGMLDIAKNVEKEQLVALKILRLVNSAHFGLSRKVSSIQEATSLIGMEQLKTLVIASGLINSVPAGANFDIKQFWSNTFRTATYSKWIAENAGLNKEIAYTAGLFSSLGIVLIFLGAPKESNEIEQHVKAGGFRPEIETNRIGFTNQAVCIELLKRWKIGEELIDIIAQSAYPLLTSEPNPLACCLFLANYLSNAQSRNISLEEIVAHLPIDVVSALSIQPDCIKNGLDNLLNSADKLDGLIE